jgi:hypothetical protein
MLEASATAKFTSTCRSQIPAVLAKNKIEATVKANISDITTQRNAAVVMIKKIESRMLTAKKPQITH